MNRRGARPGRARVRRIRNRLPGVHQIRRFVGERFAASFGDPRFETEVRFQDPMTRWPDRLTPVLTSREAALTGAADFRPRAAGDDDRRKRGGSETPGNAVITRTKPQTKKPSLYRVLILNDDYTPMEFVVHVLERFFNKDREAATRIMLHVHHHGIGECGVFTYEVAETKVTQVMDFARKHQHPLQCVMEKK
jgi:ATP-dependent Clp protease adaptor protein ClpS